MAQSIGDVFAPTFANADVARRGGVPAARAQDAIQVLNFRLPTVVGAATSNALSPLVSQDRRGDFGGAVLQSVLRTVLGADAGAILSGSPAANDSSSANDSPVQQQGRDPGSDVLNALAGRGLYDGWAGNERDLKNRPAPADDGPGSPYDPGKGFNPMPPSKPDLPTILPGQHAPDPSEGGPAPSGNVPEFTSPPRAPEWADKYGSGGWGTDYQQY